MQVLRQLATSAGLGRKRPKLKRDDKDKLGTEGEDIIADEAGSLKLRLPARSACALARLSISMHVTAVYLWYDGCKVKHAGRQC